MADVTESPSSVKVRELIFAYERHSNSTKPLEEYTGRPRAKSIGNNLSYKMFREANLEFHSIIDIEKELVKIAAHLNYYEVYDKATHVAFQEQLFNVLTSIVNIDPEDQESAVQLKKKLILETQKLATDLNSRLPYDGSRSYKGARRTYSSYVRKEEAVVSTTSVKSSEHRAILSSQSSLSHTLNGGFKSDESLNSTKDSVDLSSRQGESSSVDLNYLEDRPQSSTPPPQKKTVDETQIASIPSVSKLRQFFSFRRETKPEVKVTSASYSGLSRSQSLNVKTNKYTITKRSKKEVARKQEDIISESDEGYEKNDQEISSSQKSHISETIDASQSADNTSQLHSLESDEPVKEVEEYVEEQNEATHNVSVSKLKGLFEINRNETNEGLGLLTKKHNEFTSDFDVPFTAMNLGAYRLKRTISGNYMNFSGLLRNVDIEKKGDLSKSKSLSNLKITNFSYGAKYLDNDNDLSKEIDDNEDYEHVSIDGKKEEEVNNNVTNNDDTKNDDDEDKAHEVNVPIQLRVGSINDEKQSRPEVSTSVTHEKEQRESENIFLSKSVETLKQAFENLNAQKEQTSKESGETEKYVLHKTLIEPVESNVSVSVEPVQKVPIQFRTGVTTVNTSEAVIENSTISTAHRENNDDIRYILHRTIEPISSTTDEEPKLKVPIQLRAGYVKVNQSQKVSEAVIETKTAASVIETKIASTVDKQVSIHHQSEPVLKNPLQLKVEGENTEKAAIETETTVTVDKDVSGQNESEPVLKIPVELKGGRENKELSEVTTKFMYNEKVAHEISELLSLAKSKETIKQEYGNVSSSQNSELSNEEIKCSLHETTEPIIFNSITDNEVLKVPIQSRIGLSNDNHSTIARETEINIQNVQTSQETSETLSSTGIVETLIETYETLASTSESNEEIKHVLHRTVEPSINAEEPVLKIPIKLRTFADVNPEDAELETNVQNEQTVQEASETFPPVKIVEIVLEKFEAIDSTSHNGVNTEEIKDIIHRTIEPSPTNSEGIEEPVLKVPIQLRTFASVNYSHEETTDNGEIEEIKHILHRTIEPSSSHVEDTVEPELRVPIQLRTFTAVNYSHEGKDPETTKTSLKQNEQTSHETIDMLSASGIVETRIETYELIGSTSTSQVNNEEIKDTVHRIIEPSSINVEYTDEPVLKVPIQLRTFAAVNYSQEGTAKESTSKSDTIAEAASEPLTSPGTVETLTQTFENMNSTSSTVGTNVEDIQHIIHRTIEPITPLEGDDMEEPVIKVPIQLKTGFATISGSHEIIENSEGIQKTTETTDILRKTDNFLNYEKLHSHKVSENLGSTTISDVNNEEIKHILYRIEPSSTKVEGVDEHVLNIPIQLRTFASVNYSNDSTGDETTPNNKSDRLVEATSESLALPGTVETLTQTFEYLNSTTSTVRTDTEDIQHIMHKTVDPIPIKVDDMEEPVSKVPIATNSDSHEVIEKSDGMHKTTKNTDILGVTEGFLHNEHLQFHKVNEESSSTDLEVNNEEIIHMLNRTIEPSSTDVEDTETPELRVPIQRRTCGTVNYSQAHTGDETTLKNATTVELTSESMASPGTVETLTHTFENISSTTNTVRISSIEDTQNIVHKTAEPILSKGDRTEDPVVIAPIQLSAGFATISGSDAVIEHSSEHKTETNNDDEIINGNTHEQQPPILKVPIQFRCGNVEATIETETNAGDVTITTTDKHENVPIVDVTHVSNGEDITLMSKDGTMSRSRIEERTGAFMKLLSAPTEFSTLNSSLGHIQHGSSTSNVSMSYFQNRSMQHTSSSHISQRIVSTSSSSSSSHQSSQSFLQGIETPTSYALLKSLSPQNQNVDSSVTISDVGGEVETKRMLKINLNVSQENIIDEILREADSLENVDEEFERVLEENSK